MREWDGAGKRGQHLGFAWDDDRLLDTIGQRAVRLSVDADAREDASGRDRGGPEASGMGNAAY